MQSDDPAGGGADDGALTSGDAAGRAAEGRWVGGAPWPVRAAAVLVGLQALAALGFAGALVIRAGSSPAPVSAVLGEAAFFALIAAALIALSVGLFTGRRGARTPAIVVQLLLLPVVYSLIGPSRQLVAGVICGLVVAGTWLLLISELARAWSMDLAPRRRR